MYILILANHYKLKHNFYLCKLINFNKSFIGCYDYKLSIIFFYLWFLRVLNVLYMFLILNISNIYKNPYTNNEGGIKPRAFYWISLCSFFISFIQMVFVSLRVGIFGFCTWILLNINLFTFDFLFFLPITKSSKFL